VCLCVEITLKGVDASCIFEPSVKYLWTARFTVFFFDVCFVQD
jgi:hypothetical protein